MKYTFEPISPEGVRDNRQAIIIDSTEYRQKNKQSFSSLIELNNPELILRTLHQIGAQNIYYSEKAAWILFVLNNMNMRLYKIGRWNLEVYTPISRETGKQLEKDLRIAYYNTVEKAIYALIKPIAGEETDKEEIITTCKQIIRQIHPGIMPPDSTTNPAQSLTGTIRFSTASTTRGNITIRSAAPQTFSNEKININTVSEIGLFQKLQLALEQARYIIRQREEIGYFSGFEDFKNRSGLPESICDKIRDKIDFPYTPNPNQKGRIIDF